MTDQSSPETETSEALKRLHTYILHHYGAAAAIGGKALENFETNLARQFEKLGAGLAPCPDQWQPIETAPDNERLDFYLDWAANCARLNPAMDPNDPFRFHRGFKKTWASIYKATHWRPTPEPPASPDTSPQENSK